MVHVAQCRAMYFAWVVAHCRTIECQAIVQRPSDDAGRRADACRPIPPLTPLAVRFATNKETDASQPKTKGAQEDARGAQAEADYDDGLDTIVGWNINRKDSTVTLTTKRSTDGTLREVPEEVVHRANEEKLVAYWAKLGKKREVTIDCGVYRIFKILDHEPAEGKKGKGKGNKGKGPRLLIQWVGYTAAPDNTSWEPVGAMLDTDEALVRRYLSEHGLTINLTPKKQGADAAGAGHTSATTTASRSRQAKSGTLPAPGTTATTTGKRARPTSTDATPRAKRGRGRKPTGMTKTVIDLDTDASQPGKHSADVPEPSNPSGGKEKDVVLAELARKVVGSMMAKPTEAGRLHYFAS
ncbi:hypothetical protein GGTG_14364 [Gaeumannomyces tritici R3-111a-1]|uniref:Chromo domain-containing protein n=1 Tax=Gaeumannomyces tritici (strain R3-111a-1) TaxID=644352 RepID=J3PLA7_GAET3|nr:hypothetical protein GGTG_14364 [Gaeumannomyces tritici R3-111a-1]EJT68057.1 hypothetical protein GGTG_14364 [Gaeumannomyces tritici R3-111a-1]